MADGGSSKVKVAVRVRPLNKRELDMGTEVVIDMDPTQTVLKPLKNESRKQTKSFAFDHCFWSMDETNKKFAGQEFVFSCLGSDVLENAFHGYNACIFAYGQTGSGKSYTMMGTANDKGLIPRICDTLFETIAKDEDPNITYKVEVSYMEIYNEKVRDLLSPKTEKQSLKVREHKLLGPYVDGLSKLVVSSYDDIELLMSEGNKSRTVAATMMNAESSRSHAVFNVVVNQSQYDEATESTGEKVSKLSLVDLAGSERVSKTGSSGDRLKEGGNINKSLSTLGLVISALADQAAGKSKRTSFVPYRDSVLTWLLKDNLGGNSKTVMVATVSPAADNYEETLSTLRYADRAKRIENHAVINEDPNAKIIRELRDEVDRLRSLLEGKQIKTVNHERHDDTNTGDIKEQLQESEKLMQDYSLTWEQKEKQTEKIHQERHRVLEEMGICVQDSGIGVKEGKYYLVNLNADPSLNELLVYYLKPHTLVGRHDAGKPQDIQLTGLGILSEHCSMDIDEETVYIVPYSDARTCINGQHITERTQLRHGDRILWGNNHFFRLSCPHSANATADKEELDETLDYDFAKNEIMLNEFDTLGKPIQKVIQQIEEHHEKEKQGALEKQKQMYEEKLEELRRGMTPGTPSDDRMGYNTSGYSSRISMGSMLSDDREFAYEESMRMLREEVIRANSLVREANQLSDEMKKGTEFAVTLQIPTASLNPGRNGAPLTSEVAVIVKHRTKGTQVWSVDKLSNKIFDMRDLYNQTITDGHPLLDTQNDDDDDGGLFFEFECHTLIGIATVWLEGLYQDVPLNYDPPIISQQGEVCGKLLVDVRRVPFEDGQLVNRSRRGSLSSEDGSDFDNDSDALVLGNTVRVQVTIIEATGLPMVLCNYVFCQYNFFDQQLTVVPPITSSSLSSGAPSNSMLFKNTSVFTIEVGEEFLDYIQDGSLAFEVYGNRSKGYDSVPRIDWTRFTNDNEDKTLAESPKAVIVTKAPRVRWGELVRRIELWVEILELNEHGAYAPVELQTRESCECGGVFQLRQGYARRVKVNIRIPKHGHLPVVCEAISGIAVGSVNVRAKIQRGLDSYQERDLQNLREKWSNSLLKRREYLDNQIQELINKKDKTVADKERESKLIDQWVSLTEERNAVMCPAAGSGVPGAPLDWIPPEGVEQHIPIIFLDLNDNMMSGCADLEPQPAGARSDLPFEQHEKVIDLPILKYDQRNVSAIASWDSSIHDSVYLNRVTQNNERVYVLLKTTVRISSPAIMNIVLRKRICVRIYKRQGIKESFLRRFLKVTNALTRCGVMYELVSHIPKQSGEETEERETLAQQAAAAMKDEEELVDGEAIMKYNQGLSHVSNILDLHKLRQKVRINEELAASGRLQSKMRKFASTPNLAKAQSFSNLWRMSNNFPSNADVQQTASERSTPDTKRANLTVNEGTTQRSSSMTSERRLSSRSNNSSRNNSFLGSDSPRFINTGEIDIDDNETNATHDAPGSILVPGPPINVSTPRTSTNSAGLQTLIEDDGPSSPGRSPIELSPKSLESKFESSAREDLSMFDPLMPSSETTASQNGTVPDANDDTLQNPPATYVAGHTKNEELTDRQPEAVQDVLQPIVNKVLRVGDAVNLGAGKIGIVRFHGKTKFADGDWVGLELNAEEGKNDGSVNGVSYFTCPPRHGLFIRADKLAAATGATFAPVVTDSIHI